MDGFEISRASKPDLNLVHFPTVAHSAKR